MPDIQEILTPLRPNTPKERSLWRNRDYLLLWSGQMISALGSGISGFALPLLVLLISNSLLQAGIVTALRELPYFLLCLPVGALIDRWDRKRVMIWCDSLRSLNMFSIPLALLLGGISLNQLYLNALIEGTLYVFFDLAERACLPRVVAQGQVGKALSQNAITGGTCDLLAPWLGGLLYGAKAILPFALDALSFALSAISLRTIRSDFQEKHTEHTTSLRKEITTGLRWVWRQPLIRELSIYTGLVNFVFPGSSALLILALAKSMHASAQTLGLIGTVGGLGYIAGSFLSGWLQSHISFRFIVRGSFWMMLGLWLLFTLASNLVVLALISALLIAIDPIYDIAQYERRATLIPDRLQGRAQSAYRLVALSTPPLGALLMGYLLEHWGNASAIWCFAGVLALLVLLASISKAVREAQ